MKNDSKQLEKIRDLKRNKSAWIPYFQREEIIKQIRYFFTGKKFHEVQTPLLVSSVIPESYLDVFTTYSIDRNDKKKKLFLTTSPEASIKKMLVGGVGSCFEITKSFRNKESGSDFHLLEFTILEWYRVKANYNNVMKDCEDLVLHLVKSLKNAFPKSKNIINNTTIQFHEKTIDLSRPWKRISVTDSFKEYADINYDDIDSLKKITKVVKQKGYTVNQNDTWEIIFHQIFFNEVEPKIKKEDKPVILYDYPKEMAALSEIKKEDPRFSERFELYIGGLELGDCYTELTDYKEQEERFIMEVKKIKKLKKTEVVKDDDFINALKLGMPKSSGIAVGVDRLIMLLTNAKTIQDTLLFPVAW